MSPVTLRPHRPSTAAFLPVTVGGLVLLERAGPPGQERSLGPATFACTPGADAGLSAAVRLRYTAELVGLRPLSVLPGAERTVLYAGLLVGHTPRHWREHFGDAAVPVARLLGDGRLSPQLASALEALAASESVAELLLGWRAARA